MKCVEDEATDGVGVIVWENKLGFLNVGVKSLISFVLLAKSWKTLVARLEFLFILSIKKSTVVASYAMLGYLAASMRSRTSL